MSDREMRHASTDSLRGKRNLMNEKWRSVKGLVIKTENVETLSDSDD